MIANDLKIVNLRFMGIMKSGRQARPVRRTQINRALLEEVLRRWQRNGGGGGYQNR
jgi:hypothetical protein